MTTYRIKDWEKHFAKSDAKRCKNMLWVPIPTKHDGLGYLTLIKSKNGPAMYGCWIAIVAVAAKCPNRGTLEVSENNPMVPEQIAIKTGMPSELVTDTIRMTLQIGWLEEVTKPIRMTSGRHPDTIRTTRQDKTIHNSTHTSFPAPQEPEECGKTHDLLAVFCREYKLARSVSPVVDGKTAACAKRLAKVLTPERAQPLFRAFLADPDPFLARTGHDLAHFRPNKYLREVAVSNEPAEIKESENHENESITDLLAPSAQ